MPKKEYILCAAIWYKDLPRLICQPKNIKKGLVVCGYNHNDIIQVVVNISKLTTVSYANEQGFLTSKNRFVDREEAAIIAFEADQTDKLLTTLYSEDIY